MNEYVKSRFSVGDIVRNNQTNEDGKIDRVSIEDAWTIKYEVHIPMDEFGWELGTREAGVIWDESEVSASPNELLK